MIQIVHIVGTLKDADFSAGGHCLFKTFFYVLDSFANILIKQKNWQQLPILTVKEIVSYTCEQGGLIVLKPFLDMNPECRTII